MLSISSLNNGASSMACLNCSSENGDGKRQIGAWTSPTPGIFPEFCIKTIEYLRKQLYMQTLNWKTVKFNRQFKHASLMQKIYLHKFDCTPLHLSHYSCLRELRADTPLSIWCKNDIIHISHKFVCVALTILYVGFHTQDMVYWTEQEVSMLDVGGTKAFDAQ